MGLDVTNLSSGFPTKRDSNQSPQLQRLARKSKFACSKFRDGTFQNANYNGADQSAQAGLRLCCLQTTKDRFSRVEAHMIVNTFIYSHIFIIILEKVIKDKPIPIQALHLFDLILYAPSTIFQLNMDGSSWVEPVLS